MDVTQRPLSEILAELGEIQDRLLESDPEDFATRADLSNRQDALRQEAKDARDGLPLDSLGVQQLEREIAHLEDELERYLGTRPSASAASGGGGPGGGGIDPGFLHAMHRQMDSSFGYAAKGERLQALRVRLAELTEVDSVASPRLPPNRSRLLMLGTGFLVVTALAVLIAVLANRDSGSSVTTVGPSPTTGDVLVPAGATVVVTEGDRVVLFDDQGRAMAELGGGAGEVELNHAAHVAFSDGAAGLVYLEQAWRQIRHWPDPASPARTVVGVGELGVDLFDVALVAGRPKVLAGLHLSEGGNDGTTLLALVDMETYDSIPVGTYGRTSEQGGLQRAITAASYAEDRVLVSARNEDSWWFELYNLAGSDDRRGLPYHADKPASRVGHGVLSPDATTMAYLDGGTVVVHDLTTGTERSRWPLTSGFDRVERLDFNGILLIVSFDDQSEPILINTVTGTTTPLSAVGVATLIDR